MGDHKSIIFYIDIIKKIAKSNGGVYVILAILANLKVQSMIETGFMDDHKSNIIDQYTF